MSVTIKDIARIANVAVGTVSRVINHRPDVDPELRERVERVLQECKYRPSARARNFATGSSTILSYILCNRDFLHPIHSHILQGVEQYCEEADYFVIFTRFIYSPQTRADNIRLPRVLQSHGIADCVILAGENYDNFTKVLEQEGMRYVLLANTFVSKNGREPLDQVGFDEFGGALEATRHLIQLGHKEIWYIGDTNLQWFRVRWQGYVQGMREAGLEPRAQTIGLSNDPFTNGLKSARMIIEGKNPLTAIFAGNDDIAYGALEGLRADGLDSPRDVSLVGFHDQYGTTRTPFLTSVSVDMCEVGRQLAKMAIAKVRAKDRRFPELILPSQLIRRETCRALAPLGGG